MTTPPAPTRPTFRPLTITQLRSLDVRKASWIVDELLPTHSLTLLTARQKAGKGLLTLDLLAAIATGEPFLDRKTRRFPVMYCATEESIATVTERIETRLGDHPEAPLYVLPLNGATNESLQMDHTADFEKMVHTLARHQTRVLVLDSFRELHHLHENSGEKMAALLRPWRRLAHLSGAAIVINHHQNKRNTFRGSTAILAAADQEWSLHRIDTPDSPPLARLTISGRHTPKQTLFARLTPTLHWEPFTPDPTVYAARPLRSRILALLTDRPDWVDTATIRATLRADPGNLSRELHSLTTEHPPLIERSGTGRRNSPYRYRLRSQVAS